jgi:hypothetical protein
MDLSFDELLGTVLIFLMVFLPIAIGVYSQWHNYDGE